MKHRNDLTRGDPLPSTWVNALMEFVGSLEQNLTLALASSTTLRASAGVGNDQVALAIGHGAWRFNSAPVTAVHPAGAAGIYYVWVTAHENDLDGAVDPDDATDYAFGLLIRAGVSGAPDPPPASGATALSRLVGRTVWDGTRIVRVLQTGVSGAHLNEALAGGDVDPALLAPPIVTTLPVDAVDGQQILLHPTTDSTFPVWQFRFYDQGGVAGWLFEGGTPMLAVAANTDTVIATGAWSNITHGPTLTVPASGIYDCRVVADIDVGSGTSKFGLKVGGSDPAGVIGKLKGTGIGATVHAEGRVALDPGTPVTFQINTEAAGTSYSNRQIRVTPVVLDPVVG